MVDVKTLIHLDDPEHNKLRKLTVDWFKPSTLGKPRRPVWPTSAGRPWPRWKRRRAV